jgi:tetratricopeptide (TPR) repeat protein
MRGYVNQAIKNNSGAIADLTKAVELNPSNSDAYLERGKLYYALNNKIAARIDWTKAMALGSRIAAVFLKYPPQKYKPSTTSAANNWVVWKK